MYHHWHLLLLHKKQRDKAELSSSVNKTQHEKPVWRIAPCSFSNRCPSHHHSCHTHTRTHTLSERTAHAYGLIFSQLNHRDNTSAFKAFVSCVTDNSSGSSFIALNLFVSCSRAVERFSDLSQATQRLRIYTHKFGQSVLQSENTQSFTENTTVRQSLKAADLVFATLVIGKPRNSVTSKLKKMRIGEHPCFYTLTNTHS